MFWLIGAGVLLVIAALLALLLRRRSASAAPTTSTTVPTSPPWAPPTPPVRAPMTGLEAALAQVTDRQGRPIRDHIDAEAEHVDELRDPDDTGPLLRRALDHVEQHETASDRPPGATPAERPTTRTR